MIIIYNFHKSKKAVNLTIFVLLPLVVGCLGTSKSIDVRQEQYIDYALASNGATVTASGETINHPAKTVINGIKDSAYWDEGEGWETLSTYAKTRNYNYPYNYPYNDPYNTLSNNTTNNTNGPAWIEIQLPEEKKINKIIIHAYYNKKNVRHGLGQAKIQCWYSNRWQDIAHIENGFYTYPKKSKPQKGKYETTFIPIITNKIRIIIIKGDRQAKKILTGALEEHWVRIVEIIATGDEKWQIHKNI